MKPIMYLDMDNVLVDFESGIDRLSDADREKYDGRLDECPGIFALMDPMPGAIDVVNKLADRFELYILSTAPWLNPTAWSDKLLWVQKHFGKEKDSVFYKRLILSHHKNLCTGTYLIDDREKNGASDFSGELILFGGEKFPDWSAVFEYLFER